jgi:hypothetical protein
MGKANTDPAQLAEMLRAWADVAEGRTPNISEANPLHGAVMDASDARAAADDEGAARMVSKALARTFGDGGRGPRSDGTGAKDGDTKAIVQKVQSATVQSAENEAGGPLPFVPFPLACLPPEAAAYVRAFAPTLNADPAMIAVPMLAGLASTVGNAARVEIRRTWHEHAAFWTAVVSRSGTGKTPAMNGALRPVHSIEAEAREAYERALEEWEERRARAQADGETFTEERPTPDRLTLNNATIEAVGARLESNPRGLLLYRDELAAWLGSFDRYTNGDGELAQWLELYNNVPISIDRKTGDKPSIYLNRPFLGITGAIQPSVLREKLGEIHFTSGLAARIWFVEPPERPRQWIEADVTREVAEAFGGLFRAVRGAPYAGEPRDLPLTPDAKRIFKAWWNENAAVLDATGSEPLRAMLSKAEALAARLALTLQLAHNPEAEAVEAHAMERGVHLAKWFRYEAARVYQRHDFAARAVSAEARNLARLPDPFAWGDVASAWGVGRRRAHDIRKDLYERGKVEDADGKGKYRVAPGVAPPISADFGRFEPPPEDAPEAPGSLPTPDEAPF